jgi:hypothetical protein
MAVIRRLGAARDALEIAMTAYVPPERLRTVGYEVQDIFAELDDDPAG